jgi:hypothetical protein
MRIFRFVVIIPVLISFFCSAKVHSEPIQKEWVKQDSLFIARVAKAYKGNPLSIEFLLSYKGNDKTKLGFDYYEVSGLNGKGYVSLGYDFIYHKNQLVSFEINAEMPRDNRLTKRYLRWYSTLFSINQYKSPEPIYYGYYEMTIPLSPYPKTIPNDNKIAFYMSPYSGIMYGDEGGWGSTLENRRFYRTIERSITPDMCALLLYSKNPATRFTAVEFYYKHPQLFKIGKESIEKRIKLIFDELPEIPTMAADEEVTESSRELVQKFIHKN